MSVPNDRSASGRERRPPVVIRDRRRIDPVTLQPRGIPEAPAAAASTNPDAGAGQGTGRQRLPEPEPEPEQGRAANPPAGGEQAQIAKLRAQLSERTADLQRTKAEYDNYRKRVRRDRRAVQEIAVANVLAALLPLVDTVEQAREHGEASKAFTPVADLLEAQLAALGLQSVGDVGEPFDPRVHEALEYTESEQQERPVCSAVLRSGYRVGDHLLRPAQVVVTGPPTTTTGGTGVGTGTGTGAGGGTSAVGEQGLREPWGKRGGRGSPPDV
ncbi:nucleotide exchange factor GrpE [Streptomyces peucetius]|nr:nucleotide exchange factor GrpE [Streptomyces peucetius subsp. caesius ATCC 27952]